MRIPLLIMLVIVFAMPAHALVSVSSFGYHPDANKQVVWYTNASSGTALLKQGASTITSFPLVRPVDHNGVAVNCQGNQPCLVADFSSVDTAGTYYFDVNGDMSREFTIGATIYEDRVPILLEFFDATILQGSSFHGDMHENLVPPFPYMADGSFILESHQAALPLIRLGSAYRRNPVLFSSDEGSYTEYNGSDMAEHILLHARYLAGLQGLTIEERTDGVGFRLEPTMKVKNAFVPGPTTLSELDVYAPGASPVLIETVPVVSLCGSDDGSALWDECMLRAAEVYKCQADEPCLNMSYEGLTGTVQSKNGFGVSLGWGYEFGCFNDIDLENGGFADSNPCLIFYDEVDRTSTVEALLAFMEALPAIQDLNTDEASQFLGRAIGTADFVESTYSFLDVSDDAGYYGAALFLLYDATGNESYLVRAHALRTSVPSTLISDVTRGREYYWEEYGRHKQDIEDAGLQYLLASADPAQKFRGKMYFDWKDRGEFSISRNGERVYELDHNIRFSNSRFMLTEGVIAAKTVDLFGSGERFIPLIADHQLSWLTGMNSVQQGVSLGAPTASYSFIYGLDGQPNEQHTRLLVNTGFSDLTGGVVDGARGTGLQFFNGTDYNYLDGKFEILGHTLGALGNSYRDEEQTQTFMRNQTYKNGLTYIPGWINGVFDISDGGETDTIFNYVDNLDTYEYTESTNEMVATALELLAYIDAQRNGRVPHPGVSVTPTFVSDPVCGDSVVESPEQCDDGNTANGDGCSMTCQIEAPAPICGDGVVNQASEQCDDGNTVNGDGCSASCEIESVGGTCFSSVETIPVSCSGTISSDTFNGCRQVVCSGKQILACDKNGFFEMYNQGGPSSVEICLGDACMTNQGYVKSKDYPICLDTTPPQNGTITIVKVVLNDNNGSKSADDFTYAINGNVVMQGVAYSFAPGSYVISESGSEGYDATFSGDCAGDGSLFLSEGENATCVITNDDVDPASLLCYESLALMPATCSESITTDTYNGCRTVVCGGKQILACEKSGFFEMYNQGGPDAVEICLGDACMTNQGYVKSSTYPICVDEPPICTDDDADGYFAEGGACGIMDCADSNGLVNPGATEACNGIDDDCNGLIDEGGVCSVCGNAVVEDGEQCDDGNTASGDGCSASCQIEVDASVALQHQEWFPQGSNTVLVCEASGFTPTSYDFVFGDGEAQYFSSQNNVWHTYPGAGMYSASCRATDGVTTVSGNLSVVIE